VFGGRGPVRVDRRDLLRIGVTRPSFHETLCDSGTLVDLALRNSRSFDAAGGLSDVRQCHYRCTRQLFARGVVVDVEDRLIPPDRRQHRQAGLHVDAHVAGVDGQWERLGGAQSPTEFSVHQERPHVSESDPLLDQFLDVDPAITQRAAILVRFGDLGGEGHDAFQSADEILGHHSHLLIVPPSAGTLTTGR